MPHDVHAKSCDKGIQNALFIMRPNEKYLITSKFQLEEKYKCEVRLVGSHKRSHFEAI
jgi:hypothetical protein